MKKGIITILILMTILFLNGCNKEVEKPEEVLKVQRKIDKALEAEPTYEDVKLIKEEYNDLLKAEKEMIENYDKIEDMLFPLNEDIISCIASVRSLRLQLINPGTLELIEVSCAHVDDYEKIVRIRYSATNKWGYQIKSEYFQKVGYVFDKDDKWECFLYDNLKNILNSDNNQDEWEDLFYEQNEVVIISTEQIMDNIGIEIEGEGIDK